jgi:hypothetical protein
MAFKKAFLAFPGAPMDLKDPLVAAAQLANKADSVQVKPWPQMDVFGASIPDEVRASVEVADVLVCDVTQST